MRGDLFAGAGGGYDRVLANPPFVPRPHGEITAAYSDGGPRGDDVLARILTDAPAVLAPGGALVVVTLVADSLVDGDGAPLGAAALAARFGGRVDVARGRAFGVEGYGKRVGHRNPKHAQTYGAELRALGVETLSQALFFCRFSSGDGAAAAKGGGDRGDLWGACGRLRGLRAAWGGVLTS